MPHDKPQDTAVVEDLFRQQGQALHWGSSR